MLGGIAIGRWAEAGRRTSCAVLALLLLVAGVRAAAPPPDFVGPIDVESWIRGPVYVMHLDGGSRHGLIPEIFAEYLEAAKDLDEYDRLIVVLDGHQVGPRFLDETVDFARALKARTRVVSLAQDAHDGTAALALAFDERYLLAGGSLIRSTENAFNRRWDVFLGFGWPAPGERSRFEDPPMEAAKGLLDLALTFVEHHGGLSYEVDESGEVAWCRGVGGTHLLGEPARSLAIGGGLALESGVVRRVVADERELAVALTSNPEVQLVRLGEDIPRHWAGLFGSADRLVRSVFDEIYELLRQAEDEGEPVSEAVLDELEQKLPLLHYWERELGSMAWRYGFPEGANTPDYYESQVRLMRQTGRPPSAFTREDLGVLRVEVWPESESSETE